MKATRHKERVRFFAANPGDYYWYPEIETKRQGKMRCAQKLAHAERRAIDGGYTFEWDRDCNPWHTWVCRMIDPEGGTVRYRGGIDFGRNGDPWGDPYRRVVEAELAWEQLF